MPVTAGNVQIDCPVTKGYNSNAHQDSWGVEKDARLRLWPKGSPFIIKGTFVYPIKQRLFAEDTWMSNEPVDAENVSSKAIYYHDGLDFGGSEELVEIISATDGLVVSAGDSCLPGYENTPVRIRYDAIYIFDNRGWCYRYSHLFSIDPAIHPGVKVKMGQKIGMLGKEGTSGGWSHLHFAIKNKQPSGKWGTEDGYAYVWESYVRQYNPPLIAVARPHQLAYRGQTVTLDGRKSKSFVGNIITYEWIFSDGSINNGPIQQRKYNFPGTYSEILKIVDSKGNIDYDFAVVQVCDKNNLDQLPPRIQANYYPTFGIKPGDPVTFKVRTFNTDVGNEVWDFGDGTPPVITKSVIKRSTGKEKYAYKGYDIVGGKYAETVHSFEEPGHYIVRIQRSNKYDYKATAHLHIEVMAPDIK
ncbi:peptidoglycan DD-metalloendopeptidase family protein [bacterium]|nr:peptidoglycan DD-metalloendopeptidase family protein [bacterium]